MVREAEILRIGPKCLHLAIIKIVFVEQKKDVQNVFVSAIKDAEMYSMAFPDNAMFTDAQAQPVKIVLGSSCSTEVRPDSSQAKVVRDLHP